MGATHLDKPSEAGMTRRVPSDDSITMESQKSASTLAKEVKISANMTSAKYTPWYFEGVTHL